MRVKIVHCFLVLLVAVAVRAEGCDKAKCKGPLRHYEDLKCKPIYEKPGDCCAVRYDCSHLSGRSADKCYVNGREYEIGDQLKDEDRASPCDIACSCVKGYKDAASFTCAVVDCFQPRVAEGCYYKRKLDSCCDGEVICPIKEDVKCELDGKTYKDGEWFSPKDNPQISCLCSEGYKGENVLPFCKNISCGTELRHSTELRENCIPVFYSGQMPQTSCSVAYRCQNDNDTIMHADPERSENKSDKSESKEASEDMMCKFGNMTMHIGDELNQETNYSFDCMKCVCEVPPTPTCQQLSCNENTKSQSTTVGA